MALRLARSGTRRRLLYLTGAAVIGASLSRAFSSVTSGRFIRNVGLGLAGFTAASTVTEVARDNVVDIGVQGGDALYALGGSMLTMMFLPRRLAMPLAVGMMMEGGRTALREFGLTVV